MDIITRQIAEYASSLPFRDLDTVIAAPRPRRRSTDALAQCLRETANLRPLLRSSISIGDRRAGQDVARTGDVRGIEAVFVGKGEQQFLVTHQVFKDTE
jgi:hypothetical protein